MVALGSDDWIDPALVLAQLEGEGEIRCSRLSAIVSENGRRLTPLRIAYEGGDGVRMLPVALLDDVMSELDRDRRRALVARLHSDGGQVVITASEPEHVPCASGADVTMVSVSGIGTISA